jgi:hypothetical protein
VHKRILSVALIGLLLNFVCYASAAASSNRKEIEFAERVKAAVAKLGTGLEARVEVRLRDKTKLKGYIREASEDSFIVVDDKTGTAVQVPYAQVKQVKGNNRLTGETIGRVVGMAIVAAIVIHWLRHIEEP